MRRFAAIVILLIAAFAPVWMIDWADISADAAIDAVFNNSSTPFNRAAVDRSDLPPPADAEVARRVKVKPGDTLAAILTQNSVPKNDAHAALAALTKIYNARNIRPGQVVEIAFAGLAADHSFNRVTLHPSVSTEIHVRRDEDGAHVSVNMRAPLFVDMRRRTGRQYVLPNNKYSIRHAL